MNVKLDDSPPVNCESEGLLLNYATYKRNLRMSDRPVSRITIRRSNDRHLVYTLVYTQLNGLVTRLVTYNFSRICAYEPGVYFAVCTGLTSNHFLENTSDMRAAVSRANRYQALPLLFCFLLGQGESLGTRLEEERGKRKKNSSRNNKMRRVGWRVRIDPRLSPPFLFFIGARGEPGNEATPRG